MTDRRSAWLAGLLRSHIFGAGQFNAKCTTWIADSIGDMGRTAELVGTWRDTRSAPANLPATLRER
jgi:hypothetical protein